MTASDGMVIGDGDGDGDDGWLKSFSRTNVPRRSVAEYNGEDEMILEDFEALSSTS